MSMTGKDEGFELEGHSENCYCFCFKAGGDVQQQEQVAKLIDWFIRSALRHAEAIESMQEQEALLQVESMDRFYAALKRKDGIEQFLALVDHHEPTVAGMAAVYAMREDPVRCVATLRRLATLPGLIGFRAEVALERWESGEWPKGRE